MSIQLKPDLIITLTKRSIQARYQGSFMGLAWTFVTPLVMLIIYTFVFGVAFQARWRADVNSQSEFALILFSGLLVYNVFAESANQAAALIISNVNLVKKVVFPLETLSVVSVFSALIQGFIGFLIWLAAHFVLIGVPPATIFYVPLVFLPLILFCLGTSWILSSLGVYIRDLQNLVAILTTAMLFLSPIFYPITALPERFHLIFLFNPLTVIIEQFRNVAYFGLHLDWSAWLISMILNGILAFVGIWWFMKTKKGFADVV